MQEFQVEVDHYYHRPLAFAPDGRYLFVAAKNFTRIDTTDGAVRTFPEIPTYGRPFALVRYGAAVAYIHTALREFDLATGKERLRPDGKSHPYALVGDPRASALYISDYPFAGASILKLLNDDMTDRTTLVALNERVEQLALSADGRWLAGRSSRVVRAWNVGESEPPGREAMRVEWKGPTFAFALSGDGARLVVATNRSVAGWDTASGDEVFRNGRDGRKMRAVACHPSQPVFATGGEDGYISLWDYTGRVRTRLDWDLTSVRDLTFSADGLRCAAVGGTGKVVVWDVDV